MNLALRALAVVPLARVITIAMAHPDVSDAVTVLATAVAVSWLAIRVASAAELDRWSLVALPLQPVPILAGAVLGVVAYVAGAPTLAAKGADTSEVVVAAVALVVAGATQELVFRGVLQATLQRAAGRPGVILGVLVFASTYIGFRSLELVLVMLLAGLLFANAVMRTGATGATMLGHALLGLGAGAVWPRVLGEDARTWLDETELAAPRARDRRRALTSCPEGAARRSWCAAEGARRPASRGARRTRTGSPTSDRPWRRSA